MINPVGFYRVEHYYFVLLLEIHLSIIEPTLESTLYKAKLLEKRVIYLSKLMIFALITFYDNYKLFSSKLLNLN